jgi:hypothetical protein
MKRASIGALIFFVAATTLFRWSYSENPANSGGDKLSESRATSSAWLALTDRAPQVSGMQTPIKREAENLQSIRPVEELRQRAKDIAACLRLQNRKRAADSLLGQTTNSLDEYSRSRVDQSLEMVGAQIKKFENEGACSGLDANLLTGIIYPLLLDMARLGDPEAADCYVSADFALSEVQLSPDAVEEYRLNAEALIRDGMEKGDWRMVELMQTANDRDGHAQSDQHTWFQEISTGNSVRAYGYTRLLRLGASDSYGAQLDHALETRKAALTPQQIAEQDAWAEQEFKAHFTQSPSLNERIPPCALYSDTRVYHHVSRSPN